jgi:hypothetical protein
LSTPGFLNNGINFEPLIDHYIANGYKVVISDPAEIRLVMALMDHVINTSYEYNEEDSFAKTRHGRFQMIFNSSLEELIMKRYGKLIKKSGIVWLLNGSYEKGTDFQSNNNVKIEAKVYKNETSMLKYAKKGSTEFTVFHGAEYVLCYLIDSCEGKHWYWLRKINGIYTIYNNKELEDITDECLPSSIPICYCKLTDDALIIGKNNYCK